MRICCMKEQTIIQHMTMIGIIILIFTNDESEAQRICNMPMTNCDHITSK